MVNVATGAGQSLVVRGVLDTKHIESGFNRVKTGFRSVKGQSESFRNDLVRMSIVAGGLAKSLGALALVGAGAMVAMASKAPAVAPALAMISVEVGKLQRALGSALAPSFEKVGGLLQTFTGWVEKNKDGISTSASKLTDWGIAFATQVSPALSSIGKFAVDHPNVFAGIVAGAVATPMLVKFAGVLSAIASSIAIIGANPIVMGLIAGGGLGAYLSKTRKDAWLDEGYSSGQSGALTVSQSLTGKNSMFTKGLQWYFDRKNEEEYQMMLGSYGTGNEQRLNDTSIDTSRWRELEVNRRMQILNNWDELRS